MTNPPTASDIQAYATRRNVTRAFASRVCWGEWRTRSLNTIGVNIDPDTITRTACA